MMASERLNLPPVSSATHRIIQPANEDTALFLLQCVQKTGAHFTFAFWQMVNPVHLLWGAARTTQTTTRRQGSGPRRAIQRDARSNKSLLRHPDNANKSSEGGARRDARSNETRDQTSLYLTALLRRTRAATGGGAVMRDRMCLLRAADNGGILEDATGNGGVPMEGRGGDISGSII
jgi:hypothetical protein